MSWINGAGFIELNNKSGPFFKIASSKYGKSKLSERWFDHPRMSAFPESGRSDRQKSGEIRVGFRLEFSTMTDHLVESRHRIWRGIFDAVKASHNILFPSQCTNTALSGPSKLWKITREPLGLVFFEPEHKTVCDRGHSIDFKTML